MASKPFIFLRRGRVWTIGYKDASGKPKQKPTRYRGPEEEAKARACLALFIAGRARDARLANAVDGPLTVAMWAKQWLAACESNGVATDGYRARLKLHILPVIGHHLRLDAVTTEHIEAVMAAVKAKGLAPRTRRHVYWTAHAMFGEAIPRLLMVNPCQLKRRQLPKKKDADPEWRATAIFTRAEVVMLLTDERIPPDRRVVYAFMFLAGLRFGEASALKWRHYLPELEPLGQLQVARSFDSRERRLKDTKAERPRKVPVHSWLADILAGWRAGWAEMMGRPPAADDPIVPTKKGTHRNCSTGWKQLNGEPGRVGRVKRNGERGKRGKPNPGDLARLGLRPRRQHDARRTFITLARADGARKDLLRLVTHGPEGDIIDIYSEMPWAPLCKEIAKLQLGPSCQEVAMLELVRDNGKLASDPRGIRKRVGGQDSDGQPIAPNAKPYKTRGPENAPDRAAAAMASQKRQMATMATNLATMALRQALAAIRLGRVDLAEDILERAIESEDDADKAVRS